MTPSQIDDELLMAYADGELDESRARDVARAAAEDASIARRIELFRQTRALSRAAGAAEIEHVVPSALRSSVEAAISAQPRRLAPAHPAAHGRAFRVANIPAYAIAASFVAFAALVGFMVGHGLREPSPDAGLSAQIPTSNLRAALDRLPSGARERLGDSGEVHMLATFRLGDGRLCREFELHAAVATTVAAACRSQRGWDIAFTARVASEDGQYAPASAGSLIEAWLSTLHAGPPMPQAEERAALGLP